MRLFEPTQYDKIRFDGRQFSAVNCFVKSLPEGVRLLYNFITLEKLVSTLIQLAKCFNIKVGLFTYV